MDVIAEALAAATGIPRVLEPKPGPVTEAEMAKALEWEGKAVETLRRFLTRKDRQTPDVDLPKIDYFDLLNRATVTPGVAQREDLVLGVQEPDLVLAYQRALDRGLTYLKGILPKRVYRTVVGDENVEPSHHEMAIFRRAWQVAKDPRVIFDDMAEGVLVTDQVRAFEAMFPRLYAALVQALFMLLVEAREKKEGWTPAWWKQRQIETFTQMSIVDAAFARQLQDASTRADAATKRQGPAPQALDVDARQTAATPTQRLEAR